MNGVVGRALREARPSLGYSMLGLQLVLIGVGLGLKDWSDYVCLGMGTAFTILLVSRYVIAMRRWRKGMRSYKTLKRDGVLE